jgi:uncharacterized protein YutD
MAVAMWKATKYAYILGDYEVKVLREKHKLLYEDRARAA